MHPYPTTGLIGGASKAACDVASAASEPVPVPLVEKMRSVGWMLQQIEEQRQHAQILGLTTIEEMLDVACTELTVTWARMRKENRERTRDGHL